MTDILKKLKELFVLRRAANYCPVCQTQDVSFVPLPDFYRQNAMSNGFKYFGQGEMTAHETYSCAQCGASDRERLCGLWIDQQLTEKVFRRGARVIHFAPETALSGRLRGIDSFDYKTADLLMDGVDYNVDMMGMPFEDESCDFFICSHVLEHVESDDIAISELYRITAHGGRGILMAPIIVGLEKTIEDPRVTDDAGRWKLFGQNDHVRLYAHNDYVGKIRSHGFQVEELGEEYFGSSAFRALGLKPSSILYVVSK